MSAISTTGRAEVSVRGYLAEVRTEIVSDKVFYAIALGYALLAAIFAYAVGAPQKIAFFNYIPIWLKVLASLMLAAFTVVEVFGSVRADAKEPLARLKTRMPDILNPRLVAGFVLVLAVITLEGVFTSVKNLLPMIAPITWDPALAEFDKALAGGSDPWTRLQPILGVLPLTEGLQILYAAGWMMAICAATAFLAMSRSLAHLRGRFFLTYALCWIVLGNVLAGAFMSAGPVYFGEMTGDHARFQPLMAYLSHTSGSLHSSFDIQRDLWALFSSDKVELGSGISAFPSMHVAMATLFMWTGFAVRRWLGFAGLAFLVLIQASSVHLAWHYAVDGYVSILLTTVFWFAIGALAKRKAGAYAPVHEHSDASLPRGPEVASQRR